MSTPEFLSGGLMDEGEVQSLDPERTERELRAEGRCAHQTGYGLPWYTYCGSAMPCPLHASDPTCNERGIPQSECPWHCLHTDENNEE